MGGSKTEVDRRTKEKRARSRRHDKERTQYQQKIREC